jgi:hypothetical protein
MRNGLPDSPRRPPNDPGSAGRAPAFRLVPPGEIDATDRTFAFRLPGVPAGLRESIERFGVRTPLLLRRSGTATRIVSGFRRVEAAQGLATVPALVWTRESLPDREALDLWLEDNRFASPLRACEAGRILAAFRDLGGLDLPALEADVAPRLGLPTGRDSLERHLALADFDEDWLRHESAKDAVLLALARLDAGARKRLWSDWVAPVRPSVQDVRRAVEWLLDLEGDGGPTAEERVRALLDENVSGNPAGFLQRLRARRFQRIARWEEAIRRAASRLPGEVRIAPPPSGGDDTIEFRIRARSADRLREAAARLADSRAAVEAVFEAQCPSSDPDASSSTP